MAGDRLNRAFLDESDSDVADSETFTTVAVVELPVENKSSNGKIMPSAERHYITKVPEKRLNVRCISAYDADDRIDFAPVLPCEKYLPPDLTYSSNSKMPAEKRKKIALAIVGLMLIILLSLVAFKAVESRFVYNPGPPVIHRSAALAPSPRLSSIASPEIKWPAAAGRAEFDHLYRLKRDPVTSSEDLLGLSVLIFSKNIYRVSELIILFFIRSVK